MEYAPAQLNATNSVDGNGGRGYNHNPQLKVGAWDSEVLSQSKREGRPMLWAPQLVPRARFELAHAHPDYESGALSSLSYRGWGRGSLQRVTAPLFYSSVTLETPLHVTISCGVRESSTLNLAGVKKKGVHRVSTICPPRGSQPRQDRQLPYTICCCFSEPR